MSLTSRLIALDEGNKFLPYQDSKGIWTVGIGHNLEANGLPLSVVNAVAARAYLGRVAQDDPMPYPDCLSFLQRCGPMVQAEVEMLFDIDLKANCGWLWQKPWWPQANEARQAALNDMAFNLGEARAQQFVTFYGLCAAGDWKAAADDLEFKTLVAKELPKRYGRLEQILRSGSTEGILS